MKVRVQWFSRLRHREGGLYLPALNPYEGMPNALAIRQAGPLWTLPPFVRRCVKHDACLNLLQRLNLGPVNFVDCSYLSHDGYSLLSCGEPNPAKLKELTLA
jgi:hypothetical protein